MFTYLQEQLITGSLLGDGCLVKNLNRPGQNCYLFKNQSKLDKDGFDKKSYMNWHCSVLDSRPLREFSRFSKISKSKISNQYLFSSKSNILFTELEKKWYIERIYKKTNLKRRKVIPEDLTLSPLSLCVWFMDDGYNCPKDAQAVFCTNCFSDVECYFLCDKLKDTFDIKARIKYSSSKHPMLFIGKKSYFQFMEIIKPEIKWDCFKYKVDTSQYTKKSKKGENHHLAKLTDEKVRKIFELREAGVSSKEIASMFDVRDSSIAMLLNGKRWSHLGLNVKKSNRCRPHLTKQELQMIYEFAALGMSKKEIAQKFNVNETTIMRRLKTID